MLQMLKTIFIRTPMSVLVATPVLIPTLSSTLQLLFLPSTLRWHSPATLTVAGIFFTESTPMSVSSSQNALFQYPAPATDS